MPSKRLPRANNHIVFWGAFCGISALTAFAAVWGLSPQAPVGIPAHPTHEAIEARAGKMIFDTGGDDCQQVSFNNDTGDITETRVVPCVRESKQSAPARTGNSPGFLGEMHKAFGRTE